MVHLACKVVFCNGVTESFDQMPTRVFWTWWWLFAYRFQVKKKQFFHNFLTIMSFGVFGVFISGAIVSAGRFY